MSPNTRKRNHKRWYFVWLFLLGCAGVKKAGAQPPFVVDSDIQAKSASILRAEVLLNADKMTDAIEEYRRAYSIAGSLRKLYATIIPLYAALNDTVALDTTISSYRRIGGQLEWLGENVPPIVKIRFDRDMPSELSINDPKTELFIEEVDSLYAIDQWVRRLELHTSCWEELIGIVDDSNYRHLIAVFRQANGYVRSMGSITVLMHALAGHPEDMELVMGWLQKALRDDEIDALSVAHIVDAVYITRHNCQLLGTYNDIDQPRLLARLCDKQRATLLRQQLGLQTLEIFMLKQGFKGIVE